MTISKKKLALIHIIKKELDLSDGEYRGILRDASGVTSAKDLDERGFNDLMKFFVRSRHYRINPDGLTLKQKMFIESLARQLGWDRDHLGNFLKKYYEKDGVDKLTKLQASKAIESLKHIRAHHEPYGHHKRAEGEKEGRAGFGPDSGE